MSPPIITEHLVCARFQARLVGRGGVFDDHKGGNFYLYKTHIPMRKLDKKPARMKCTNYCIGTRRRIFLVVRGWALSRQGGQEHPLRR